MAGIYLHIPFCRKKCHYCNFYSTPSLKHRDAMVPAMLHELNLQKNYVTETVNTIYFGGGTPSLLRTDEINRLIDAVHRNFLVANEPEITLEANPDDISKAKVKELGATAINRLSLGVQSFYADDLKYLNRIHEDTQSEYAIKALQDGGFSEISIDLIYGMPSLGMGHWRENLRKAVELGVPHISAYALTVEPNTNLEVLIQKRKLAAVSEAETANQFRYLMAFLNEKNYTHYEISNFCIANHPSRHNQAYWEGIPYLGIGPSAHSFNTTSRQWNCSNMEQYLDAIALHKIPFEMEVLSPAQKYNEFVMTALRTNKGIHRPTLQHDFPAEFVLYFNKILEKYTASHLLTITETTVGLTNEGYLFADCISSDFFFTP
ncbi:MAG: radical SAM family heme chaperone HemW [Bacteroidota bacterium]